MSTSKGAEFVPGLLSALPPETTWENLRSMTMTAWAWFDTVEIRHPSGDLVEKGFHVGGLPECRPRHLTHLWGWAPDLLVRVRWDRDLPGKGFVGARLRLGGESGNGERGGEEVEARRRRAEIWPGTDGKTSMQMPPGLSGSAPIEIYEVQRMVASGDSTVVATVPFVRITAAAE
jgi:hypothetical protein